MSQTSFIPILKEDVAFTITYGSLGGLGKQVEFQQSGPDTDLRVLVGAQPGEGPRGPPRPLVGTGKSPGRGFKGRSPLRKTIFSVLE